MNQSNPKSKAHVELSIYLAFVSLVMILTLIVGHAFALV